MSAQLQPSSPIQVRSRGSSEYFQPRFLRNAWYVAMWSEDLKPGALVERTILNESIVFYRREDGTVAALTNQCPHRFVPLDKGKLLPGDRIRCPYHGLEFDGTGKCVHNPHGNGAIPSGMNTRSWPVLEKHTCLWIWMGDREPDPSQIPDYSVIDKADPAHATKRDRIIVKAHVQLVADNLLDLSHGIYLHDGLLANEDSANSEITAVEEGNCVIVHRSAKGVQLVGLHREYWPHDTYTVDKFSSIRWTAPSYLLLTQGACLPGDTRDNAVGYYGIHLLTPETERTTHYHFMAVRFNVQTDPGANDELSAKIAKNRRYAFAEQDAPIIEAQQRVLDSKGGKLNPTLMIVDLGPARCKRILERLLEQD